MRECVAYSLLVSGGVCSGGPLVDLLEGLVLASYLSLFLLHSEVELPLELLHLLRVMGQLLLQGFTASLLVSPYKDTDD